MDPFRGFEICVSMGAAEKLAILEAGVAGGLKQASSSRSMWAAKGPVNGESSLCEWALPLFSVLVRQLCAATDAGDSVVEGEETGITLTEEKALNSCGEETFSDSPT